MSAAKKNMMVICQILKKSVKMLTRFDTIHQRNRQTNTRTA